ncbi:hypothetical protein C809_01860 [Lachnospiraceae bacterium MD335]|nr:hypothetical protein C809_01860 [Lachnospiraceae bacterium MD335]
MEKKKSLPMGMENFERIQNEDFYYIDKTGLIKDLLENKSYVTLFTRPRRFGKTLTMSMLKYFFEIGSDSTLFDGLEIAKEKRLCDEYRGKFPVISVSLKGVSGINFNEAKAMLRGIIGTEALRFEGILQKDSLSETDYQQYKQLIMLDNNCEFAMTDGQLKNSFLTLSRLLQRHYNQKVIILIDEYDVPLYKAYRSGYYDEMVELMRGLFGQALKTNDSLYLAVLTGCLRISKESIFTGMNNFNVYTVKDMQYNQYFGFTDAEVTEMLEYYSFMERSDVIKEWYDGYHFSGLDIYCPWDVISYCHALKMNFSIMPQNYWVNTSSNDIIRKFISKAKSVTKSEIELLIDGGSVKKKIRQELTYRDLDTNIDNLWSLLFTTGYLTQFGEDNGGLTELVIPNKEIRWIFVEQIQEWFAEETARDSTTLEQFCKAFEENNVAAIEEGFTFYLKKMISIRDTNAKKERKENFYHGILLGLFSNMDGWIIMSNAETGDGYSDILVEAQDTEVGIVVELKYAENAAFDTACKNALEQIADRNYEERLLDDGMKTIYRYGIACYKKRCRVVSE